MITDDEIPAVPVYHFKIMIDDIPTDSIYPLGKMVTLFERYKNGLCY